MTALAPPSGFMALQLLNVDYATVVRVMEERLGRKGPLFVTMQIEESDVQLPSPVHNPNPKVAHVWEPATRLGTTVIHTNLCDGWPTLTYHSAEVGRWSYSNIRVSPADDEWPICELEVFASGTTQRLVRAMKDDPKWDFYALGTPLPFEDLAQYRARRVRDRLTPSMLWSYVRSLGWEPQNAGFWNATKCVRWEVSYVAV